jgi:VWFA-related protein
MLRGAIFLALAGLLAVPIPGEAQEPPRFEGEEITVSLVPVVVRVVDTWGRPILGLKPEDFRIRAGKKEIPVEALDWIGEEAVVEGLVPSQAGVDPDPAVQEAPPTAPGRLVVFFVQADLNPTRISGQLRMRPFTRELLSTLHAGDRAAVVSYDSHFKLWQDFTPDRGAVHAAIDRAMLFSPERAVAPGDPVSLAAHLDAAAARRAATPERALELMARALEPLPGEKTVIFLGWGLGSFSSMGVQMKPDYKPAVQALRAAHASVFVLDVTSADQHSLAAGLEGVAESTGGLYLSTFRLPGLATEVLAKAISGHYVLTLDRALLPEDPDQIRIELRDHRGTVLARPVAPR